MARAKWIIRNISVLLLLSAFVGIRQAQPQGACRRIAPFVMVHDFGKVNHGTIARHVFVLKNASETNLRVVNVRIGNAPMSAKVSKHFLAASEELQLEVLVDTSRFKGAKSYEIHVETEGGESYTSIFRITIDSQ